MERDFEQEFRRLKQSETPDLWNRIEAGLSEKHVVVPIRKTAWKKWGTFAAACLAAVIIFPALSMMIKRGGSKSDSSMSADYGAMENNAAGADMMAEDTVSDSAADGMNSESYNTESGGSISAANTVGTDELEEAAGFPVLEEASDAVSRDETSDHGGNEPGDAADKRMDEECKEGEALVLEDVVLQITEADVSGEETVYTATVVQSDKDTVLKNEKTIKVRCNLETFYLFAQNMEEEKQLQNGKKYRFSLCGSGEEWVVVSVDEWN